ncbi:MAG TPA: hypothetical protein VLA34_05585, partial [Candidatus Krumholzibacterium sp.]|nr:hypothetical protein [Candidatus Krumholzibacterium sp.]
MNLRHRILPSLFASFLIMTVLTISTAGVDAGPNFKRVRRSAKMYIEIWPLGFADTVLVSGPCDLDYTDPVPSIMYPGLEEIETQIVMMDLVGNLGDVMVRKNPGGLCFGTVYIDPGPDTAWVESFFDVYFDIELPGLAPGQVFTTFDAPPLSDFVDQYPPFYDDLYVYPSPPVPLYDGEGSEAGLIMYWDEQDLPWAEPAAHLQIPKAYGSDTGVLDELGRLRLEGAISDLDINGFVTLSGTFSFRQLGDPGPFVPIDTDETPEGRKLATGIPLGVGDGLTVYFDPGSDPFEDHVYEFEFEGWAWPGGFWRDTVIVHVDPVPPIPYFWDVSRDSIIEYPPDSFFDVTFRLDDEMVVPGTSTLQVFPLQFDWTRDLTAVDQLGLGTDLDSVSCGPSAAASCLKYFADNGHPELDNPEGDETRPDASGEDIARELQKNMGTDSTGTSIAGAVAGIKAYLKNHGQDGWDVGAEPVDDATDLAEMLREFQSDSEDVMIIIYDTTAAGDTIGHLVTMGSSHFTLVPPVQRVDFMDPWGGGSTADNDYPVGANAEGQPTTSGYDLDGKGGDGWIGGYIKVSPPDAVPAESPSDPGPVRRDRPSRPIDRTPLRAPWLILDSGTVTGNGVVDTLHLD